MSKPGVAIPSRASWRADLRGAKHEMPGPPALSEPGTEIATPGVQAKVKCSDADRRRDGDKRLAPLVP